MEYHACNIRSVKIDSKLIVCVRWIGAGNAFLGGLAAGLYFAQGDVSEGTSETIRGADVVYR